jgi:small GTP-binding protein
VQELHDGRSLKVDIWDTAGQERYRTLAPLYYRNASAAVVVFDVTSKESFDGSRVWASDFQERRPNTPLILVRYHLASREC